MIEVNTDSITIRNIDFTSTEYKKFEKEFSFYNSVTFKYNHKYEYNTFVTIGNDVRCPSTITSDIVSTYFPKKKIVYNNIFPNGDNISFSVKHTPKNEIQTEALNFLLSIANDPIKPWRMLNLATGTGKTYVSISAIAKLQKKTMIIVDTTDLATQWKNQFLFHTDLKDDDICILSGMESVEEAKSNNKYKIYIAIFNTLYMLLEKDMNSLNELNYNLKIGIRIFDESHVNFKGICHINSLSNVQYTFFLTATPNRSDYREDKLYSKIFKNVPSYNGHKNQNKKYHIILLAKFNSQPSEKEKISVKTKYGFSTIKWANFLSKDKHYEKYLNSLLNIINKFKLVEKNKKFVIMLPTIDLIEKTFDDLSINYPNITIGKFIGEIKKENRQNELQKQIIITNPKIFGKGIDVSDLDCVINYSQISSKVNIEQILGRLRNNPGHSHVLIDVTDYGYIQCKNQLRSRKNFYKNVALRLIEITDEF